MNNLIPTINSVWAYFILGISFSVSVQAANLTEEETISYINRKINDCTSIVITKAITNSREYSNIDFRLDGTILSIALIRSSETVMENIALPLERESVLRTIDLRSLLEVEVTKMDSIGCQGNMKLICNQGGCIKVESKDFDGSRRTLHGSATYISFGLIEDKDVERLKKAIIYLRDLVIIRVYSKSITR